MPRARARLSRPLSAFALLSVAALSAQTPQPTTAAQPGNPYTLHVYKRVVQVPTLVLDATQHPYTHLIDANHFDISLDSGPRFHPIRVRLEGDDPISLAILVDATHAQPDLLAALPGDTAAWIANSFEPEDRISIYAADCGLARTAQQLAPDPAARTLDLRRALDSNITHRNHIHPACANSFPLWNSLLAVMRDMLPQPGRRVILYIGSPYNGSGSLTWNDIRRNATTSGVSIYGLSQASLLDLSTIQSNDQAVFRALCESSGGLYDTVYPEALPKALSHIVDLLRGRYILEFPVPFHPTEGIHTIHVSILHLDAFIQPAGVTFTLPDPALAKDPSTIPTDESNAPQMGKHRPSPKL